MANVQFLYMGLFYGLAGSLIAWLIVELILWWLNGPIQTLAALYGGAFQLQGLGNVSDAGMFLITGSLLGLLGAYLAVGWQLRDDTRN